MLSSSRFRHSTAQRDEGGNLFLTTHDPFEFVELADTIKHVAETGDTLWSIAARYYAELADGPLFYWVIADFQPEPVCFDPTLQIPEGTTLHVPSVRTIEQRILNPARRQLL